MHPRHVDPGAAGEHVAPPVRHVIPQLHHLAADRLGQAAELGGLDGPGHASANVVGMAAGGTMAVEALELAGELRQRHCEGEDDVGGGRWRVDAAVGQGGGRALRWLRGTDGAAWLACATFSVPWSPSRSKWRLC